MFSPAVENLIRLLMYAVIFVLVASGLKSVLKNERSGKNKGNRDKRRFSLVSEAKAPENDAEQVVQLDLSKPPRVKKKKPLTDREKPMYPRLVAAFPNHVVLTQVAFSAIITHEKQDFVTDRATRSKFNRMVVDFVICTKDFDVIAVIELDDSTHDGNEDKDAARDEMLNAAGYKVFRYRQIPEVTKLREDITPDEATFNHAAPMINVETA